MLERQLVPVERAKLEALNEKDRLLRASARKLGRSHVIASKPVSLSKRAKAAKAGLSRRVRIRGKSRLRDVPLYYRRKRQ